MTTDAATTSVAGAATLTRLAADGGEAFGDRPALRHRVDGTWRSESYRDLAARVRAIARGLVAIGVAPGERVALCLRSGPDWTYADLAIAEVGAVSVPIYPTESAEEYAWILGNSDVVVAWCGSAVEAAKVEQVQHDLPALRHVVVLEPADGRRDVEEVVAAGAGGSRARAEAEIARRTASLTGDDLATVIYTSGSTGRPKGCMLTHANWRAALGADQRTLRFDVSDDVYLYLPLAHSLARAVQFLSLDQGATLTFSGGDPRRIREEIASTRPTVLPSVPRLFEMVHGDVARADGEAAPEHAARVRGVFGGRLRLAITGGAPIAAGILTFFTDMGIEILEGYGMTETSAVISMNPVGAARAGTVGRPDQGVEVRIAADDEIVVRGPNVFLGYLADEAATSAVLRDGWFHTGDLGALDDDGYLTISGRKKDLIITSSGTNITPSRLEDELRSSRWIAQAVVFGDRRPHLVALLVVEPGTVLPWAAERGLPDDPVDLAAHPRLRGLLQEEIDRVNEAHAPPERIRGFTVLDGGLSVEAGELTPTAKVRRAVVARRYARLIDQLYP